MVFASFFACAVIVGAMMRGIQFADAGNAFVRQVAVGDLGFTGTAGPPGRSGHAAVVTDESEMFIFGGRASSSNGDFLNDMWLYDWNTGSWVAYTPNELLCDQCSTCQETGTTCYDWTGLRPYSSPKLAEGKNRREREIPSGRADHSMVLVLNRETGKRDTIVMFGGESIDCQDYCDDVWHYNIPNNVWTKRTFTNSDDRPVRRWKHAMTDYYDGMFMFGGHSQRLLLNTTAATLANLSSDEAFYYDTDADYDSTRPLFMADLWLYNATDRKWEYINPSCTTCDANGVEADGTGELDLDGPRGRIKASMITYQDSLYVFGGYAYGGDSNFQQLYPVPSECTGSGDTCIPREQFYASLETKFFLNDLWRYDILLKSWTELKSPEAYSQRPTPRYGHTATVIQKDGDAIMLVHGGRTWEDEIGDVWQYNFSSNVWTSLESEGEIPSRRFGSIMVPVGQSSSFRTGSTRQAGRALIFGGFGCLKGKSYIGAITSLADALATQQSGTAGRTYVNDETGEVVNWANKYSVSKDGKLVVNARTLESAGDPAFRAVEDGTTQVQTVTGYGEVICTETLSDLWQYLPDECPNDCSRSGTCRFNTCICSTGFYGKDCSQPMCPSSSCAFDHIGREMICQHCNGRGRCVDGTCIECEFPYVGESCERVGLCKTCDCYTEHNEPVPENLDCGFEERLCVNNPSTSSTQECSGNGYCVNGECQCFPGFTDSMVVTRVADVRFPANVINGTVTPAPECGYDETAANKYNPALITDECVPTYYADCGDFLYMMASSRCSQIFVALLAAAISFEALIKL